MFREKVDLCLILQIVVCFVKVATLTMNAINIKNWLIIKQHLRSQGRCFLCLKTGHIFRDCTLNPKNGCYYCGKKRHHNQAICPQKFGNPPQPPLNGDTQSDGDKEEKPPSVEVLNSTSIQTQTLSVPVNEFLLQTAIVPVQSGDKT